MGGRVEPGELSANDDADAGQHEVVTARQAGETHPRRATASAGLPRIIAVQYDDRVGSDHRKSRDVPPGTTTVSAFPRARRSTQVSRKFIADAEPTRRYQRVRR